MKENKRGALEISFGWLFAIIAGIAVLALAIYFLTRFINLQQTTIGAETGSQIGVLLNPLETNFESAKTSMFSIPSETIIHNSCESSGNFGKQEISLSQKSLGKFVNTNIDISFENKYIFSDADVQGKNFYVFSKPLDFPFKVADLIYLTSSLEDYCFVDSPIDVQNELTNLNQTNLYVKDCPQGSLRICFSSAVCDVNVNSALRYVQKQGKNLRYETNALMYAAIFSDPDVYECQVARLVKRTGELANMYQAKSVLLSSKGCSSNLDLTQLNSFVKNFRNSGSLKSIIDNVNQLNIDNEIAYCPLW